MYIVKGFITSPTFIDNEVGEVSGIGEISKNSLTYSTEVGMYQNEVISDVTLYTFKSSLGGVNIELPQEYKNLLLRVGDYIYSSTIDQIFLNDSINIRNNIINEFETDIFDVNLGSIVSQDGLWIPEWISFSTKYGSDSIKMWFVDSSFSIQYEESEFKIIPPFDNVDLFFSSTETVRSQLEENDTVSKLEKVQQAREESPYTLLRGLEYSWSNIQFPDQTLQTEWLVIVYGNQGTNDDLVKDAIVEWVLENSNESVELWKDVLPEIFKSNEYILTPLWHKFAIPNKTVEAGFNSPIVEYKDIELIVTNVCKGVGYAPPFSYNNSLMSVTPIKTLSFIATGNSYNSNDVYLLNDIFPDYINVSTSSIDFTRMSLETQEWVRAFVDLLVIADTGESDIVVPSGFGKVIREDIVFVTKKINTITYLVPTRYSVINALGLDTPYYPEDTLDEDCGCTVEDILLEEHLQNFNNPHKLTPISVGMDLVNDGDSFASTGNILTFLQGDINDIRQAIASQGDLNILDSHLNAINPHSIDSGTLGLDSLLGASIANLSTLEQTTANSVPER